MAKPLAYAMPIRIPVKLPGPTTTPIAVMSDHFAPDSVKKLLHSVGNAIDCFSTSTRAYLSSRTNSNPAPDVLITKIIV